MPNGREIRPFMIAIGGGMGVGKTTLARALHHEMLDRTIPSYTIDVDDVARQYKPVLTGADAYDALEHTVTRYAKTRIPLIVTATFRDRPTRTMMRCVAKTHGFRFIGAFLEVPRDIAVHRAVERDVVHEPGHLLRAHEAPSLIAEWAYLFEKGDNHDDLTRRPWRKYSGLFSTTELVLHTMRRVLAGQRNGKS